MTSYRTATLAEIAYILDWAASEGWNPGLDDAVAFQAADPAGFFVAVEEDVPVASISVVNHTDAFAFLGLYIAKSSHRGRGIAYRLWQHALLHAGKRIVGLDGVPEQQANYTASGFRTAGSTTRFSGRVTAPKSTEVSLAEVSDVPDLIAREATASGVRKQAYLSAWFTSTPHRKTLVDEEGFCTVRRCLTGAKIGPLVAETIEAAERLIHQAGAAMGPDLTIDVPESSQDLARLCGNLGFVAGFETTRMYRGSMPLAPPTVFSVTSLELG